MVSAGGITHNGRGTVTNIPPIPESVVKQPQRGEYGFGDYVLWVAGIADSMPIWGTTPAGRDRLLRNFWHTEPILAGAVFTMAARYAAFEWDLDGPERMVDLYGFMLHAAQQGRGWNKLMMPVAIDYLTQDNGAFIEIIRADDSPTAPVITLNHLDAARCTRTGRLDIPVIYWDRWGTYHNLKWYQVIDITEMPSPVENMRGMQYCAVSRLLRAAQSMRDISVHKHEKLSGRFTKTVHLVGGVQTQTITDAILKHQAQADDQGLTRYVQPAVIGSLDPTATVSHAQIDLAALPENYNEMDALREYITILALAFGSDYQEFAPLMTRSGGSSGGGAAAETAHLKARGKGPSLFMQNFEYAFNYHGVFPKNVVFKFSGQDTGVDLDRTKLSMLRAEERAMRIKSGEISPEVARKMAVDSEDLDPKYLPDLENYVTPEEQAAKVAQEAAIARANAPVAPRAGAGGGAATSKPKVSQPAGGTARDGNMKSPRAPQMGRDGD